MIRGLFLWRTLKISGHGPVVNYRFCGAQIWVISRLRWRDPRGSPRLFSSQS
jgi:hypothetical protein